MNQNLIVDLHTIFVHCPDATEDQIRSAFGAMLAQYRSHTPLECYFRVNLVKNGAGKSYGIAFVFVTNPAVYYMLFGRNPDGTSRVEYIDDPESSSLPASQPTLSPRAEPSTSVPRVRSPPPLISGSWADWLDDSDEFDESKPKAVSPGASGRPQIKVKLPSLMVLPPYLPVETSEATSNDLDLPAFESFAEPEPVEFMIGRAIAQPPDSKFMPNVLKCNTSFLSTADGSPIKNKGLPDWITARRLKAEFAPYASNLVREERSVKGIGTETGYPHVNINAERIAFIVFDPATTDAMFALIMMRKLVLHQRDARGEMVKDAEGHPVSATLIFSHSYRADRDGSVSHSHGHSHSRAFPSPKSRSSKGSKAPRAFIPVAPRASQSHPGTDPRAPQSHPSTDPRASQSHPSTDPRASQSHPGTDPRASQSHPGTDPRAQEPRLSQESRGQVRTISRRR